LLKNKKPQFTHNLIINFKLEKDENDEQIINAAHAYCNEHSTFCHQPGGGGALTTLREAIAAVGVGETITFELSPGNETIVINSQLSISQSMTIDGSNAAGSAVEVTVQVPVPGTSIWRVFTTDANGSTINITNMSIKGGYLHYGACCIFNASGTTLNLDAVKVTDGNSANYYGGGVSNAGTLSISNSTISGNTAGSGGGGIYVYDIENSNINLLNCSLANNHCDNDNSGSYQGGGCYIESIENLTIQNCIIANNYRGSGTATDDDYYYSNGTFTYAGYNVLGFSNVAANASGGFNSATSILYNTKYNEAGTTFSSWTQGGVAVAGSLNLSTTLADNGGPTQTLAFTGASFAAGSAVTGIPYGSSPYWNNSPTADQRGVDRFAGNNTSMGAYAVNFYVLATWDGSTDADWNTVDNWSTDAVPGEGNDVVIPDVSKAPFPIISSVAICNDLTVNSDATLTLESGSSLITNGTITNDGTIDIKHEVSNDAWHLISIPCTGITANTFLGNYMQSWDETNHAWTDITEPETELFPKQGYGLWDEAGKTTTYTFSGTPLTGTQIQGITFTEYSAEPDAYEGSNLLGNPYPSYIDWDLVSGYGAKYTWNTNTESYDAYTEVTGYGDGNQFLSPMQGFFIVTESTGNFELSNSQRTNDNSKKSAKGFEKGLVLVANSGEFENTLYLVFDETASENFELAKDAWKLLSGTPGLAEIYSINADGNLSVDVRPESESIQLGFVNDEAGVYSIAIKEIADIPTAILEDSKTNTFHNMLSKAYEFTWNPDMDDEQRFKLHFKAVGINETEISESNILIYAADHQIFIKGAESGNVVILDVMGRIVLQQNINASELTTIPVNLKTGVYVVMFRSVGSGACSTGSTVPLHKTEKVFIK